jgi:hypothetical protein
MDKGKRKSKFDKVRGRAHRFYFNKWRGNEKTTPAFGQKIQVTRSGWNHLMARNIFILL